MLDHCLMALGLLGAEKVEVGFLAGNRESSKFEERKC